VHPEIVESKFSDLFKCVECSTAKIKQSLFHICAINSLEPLFMVSFGLCGLFFHGSTGDARYFLVIAKISTSYILPSFYRDNPPKTICNDVINAKDIIEKILAYHIHEL
jgi:hypothetical protein